MKFYLENTELRRDGRFLLEKYPQLKQFQISMGQELIENRWGENFVRISLYIHLKDLNELVKLTDIIGEPVIIDGDEQGTCGCITIYDGYIE